MSTRTVEQEQKYQEFKAKLKEELGRCPYHDPNDKIPLHKFEHWTLYKNDFAYPFAEEHFMLLINRHTATPNEEELEELKVLTLEYDEMKYLCHENPPWLVLYTARIGTSSNHTYQMTLQEFKDKYLKIGRVEFHSFGKDQSTYYQCVDLINAYINEVLDTNTKDYTEIIGANAVDFATKYDKEDFTWISNDPNSIPEEGDIVVFKGGVGHVSIALKGSTANYVKSLDQNFSITQKITLETHPYTKVIGWLRPIKSPTQGNTEGEKDKKIAELEKEKDYFEKLSKEQLKGIKSLKNDVKDRETTIDVINELNGRLSQEVKDLKVSVEGALKKAEKSDINYQEKILELALLQGTINPLKIEVKRLKTENTLLHTANNNFASYLTATKLFTYKNYSVILLEKHIADVGKMV